MSINMLANAAAARRPDMVPLGVVPRGLQEIALAGNTTPTSVAPPAGPGQPPAAEAGQGSAQMDTAFHVLFGYIPTEILTLYVAVLAAVSQPDQVTNAEWITFWVFLGATPVVVWLVYGAKIKAAQKPLPLAPGTWPVWEIFAATAAYFAWALALPNTPFADYSWYSSALSGVIVLVTSTFLGLLAPFFQRPLGMGKEG